ncbi:GGDEF domain-containing protein [Cohnella boryungensis]|uniref:GGDEF domain-containing protein n=1 Tax=Cohnella boryungensis TaxID=768479 RepID=A0ABV8S6C4_9BACL
MKAKNGRELPVLLNGVRKKRGKETFIDCIFIEMSKRIEYEKEMLNARKKLEELNKAKDLAHEALKALHEELAGKQEKLIELNLALESQAYTDGLTGVGNRRSFQESLAASIAAFDRLQIPFSLVMLDIDYFKRINDTFGHPVGDEILKKLARAIQEQSREIDVVARYGGEEFAVILPDADRTGSGLAAERYRRTIEQMDWGECQVTISLGVATIREGDTSESMIQNADQALYASKSGGRNRVTHAEG